MKTDDIDLANWIPLARAAERMGSTPLNLLMHIKRGLLKGAETDGAWLVEPASLADLLEKRREGAALEVCQSGCGKTSGGCGDCR